MLTAASTLSPILALALQRDYVFWGIVVAALAGGFYLTFWFVQKRRSVWKTFALRNGLDYTARFRPQVQGTVDGRDFRLAIANRSSDRGVFGIEEVVMKLSVHSGVDCEFEITNEGVLMTAIREAAGDEQVAHVGTSDFDARTCLRTDNAELSRRYLDDERRRAMLTLIDECPGCNVHLTQCELRLHDRTSGRSLDQLNDRLGAMRAAATVFDGRGGSAPTSNGRHQINHDTSNATSNA